MRLVLASSCVAAQVSFKGFYSIANAADLTSHVTVSLVGGEMQSSCQGREDAPTRAFERLHLKRRGRRVRQLVRASVTVATGSEPLRILPRQDRTLEQTDCERAAGVLMAELASHTISLLRLLFVLCFLSDLNSISIERMRHSAMNVGRVQCLLLHD